ncbi:Tat pathway signal sequence domain protein, partial [Streptomyces nigra]
MREIVRRHLGKVVAGTAIAVAGTAVMVGITLPGTAGAGERAGDTAGQTEPNSPGHILASPLAAPGPTGPARPS